RPIAFAYAIHTQVGDHCSGARVNGAIAPLRSKLRNGDVVEVMTNPSQHPSKDWLDSVVTSRARSKIRTFLRTEQRDKSLKLGRELLEKEMHQNGMSFSRFNKSPDDIRKVIEKFGFSSADELFVGVGYGKVSALAIIDFLAPKDGEKESAPPNSLKEGRIESLVRKVTGRDNQGIRLNG